ncbi:MAG: bifunctional riboflavin kinase/FAD synthetase [Proteobacteria bacterium]|jgi:riboflavin kinase / FMN adenylyltransferase|nr:bifunctional riboflavin kinase/FAD synthetase [Pseudomonadota bacterium]
MKVFRYFEKSLKECVLTIGNYDGIHLGHQTLINHVISESRSLQVESALITFEPHPKEFFSPEKAPQRVISLREKLEFFQAHRIDRVYVIKFNKKFSKLTASEFIDILKLKVKAIDLVVGSDFRYGNMREAGLDELKASGIKVTQPGTIFLEKERISSSLVRDALKESNFARVEALLGRPYMISGRVIHGEKRGRTLGYATANIHMFHKSPPLSGVFAVKLDSFFGIANLGVRPTFGGIKKLVLEVHLLSFSKEIYDKHVHVTFYKKIRDEKKFNNAEVLSQQISTDIKDVKLFFNL